MRHFISLAPGFKQLAAIGSSFQTGDALASVWGPPPISVVDLRVQLRRPNKVVANAIQVDEGTSVAADDVLADAGGPLGLGHRKVLAPFSGTVRTIIPDEGFVLLEGDPVERLVSAPAPGSVVGISPGGMEVEFDGQGLSMSAGFGPDVWGSLMLVDSQIQLRETLAQLAETENVIVACPFVLGEEELRALSVWCDGRERALIAAGAQFFDLLDLLRRNPKITLVLTEGFAGGDTDLCIAPIRWDMFEQGRGHMAGVLTGDEDVRPSVLFSGGTPRSVIRPSETLQPGNFVRCLVGMRICQGTIDEIVPQNSASESVKATGHASVRLLNGSLVSLPLGNIRPL